MPDAVASSVDPLAVLRWASAALPPDVVAVLDSECVNGEELLARDCQPTPGALVFLHACQAAAMPVVIVSNNASSAIDTYLARFDATNLVAEVVGRTPGRPELMKPHPGSVLQALSLLRVSAHEAVFIGDTITDVQVSLATGVPCRGYAKTPQRGTELSAAGAVEVFTSMADLADILFLHCGI